MKSGSALHTGCTSSVAGEIWLREYMHELEKGDKEEVKGPMKSNKIF